MEKQDFALAAAAISTAREVYRELLDWSRRRRPSPFEDALHAWGLERRRPRLQKVALALGLIGVGAAGAAGVALIFTPVTGRDLRASMARRLAPVRERMGRNNRSSKAACPIRPDTETAS